MAMNGDVSAVNSTYRAAVHRQLGEAGGRAGLGELFDAWFADWEQADRKQADDAISSETMAVE